jgi:hypothetical protein
VSEISENRRIEYTSLREEIYRSDRTCVMLMGFLISVTGTVGGVAFSEGLSEQARNFVGWILSPIWFLGFWYFTEKRFVIIRVASYIRDQIEAQEEGLGWEQFSRNLSQQGNYRRALPLDPYHLEMVACGLTMLFVPILGIWLRNWKIYGWHFVSSTFLFVLFLVLLLRALREYGKPQEYHLTNE